MKNDNLKTFTYTCDGFFLLGLLLVLFPNFGKSRIPSFLYPFFCFDGMLSVYPFAIFSVMVIIWLFLKKDYKKIWFIIASCGLYCLGNLIVTLHGLGKIIGKVTEYDICMLDGSRLGFFNLISNVFSSSTISTRLFISEGIFAIYSGLTQYKEVFLVAILICFFYVDRAEELNKLFEGGGIATFIVVCLYEIIEIPFIIGNETSITFLKMINPFFYDVHLNGSWWPPLILSSPVLRGVFAEQSFFGYYLGLVSVLFIHLLLNNRKKVFWGIFLFLSYLFAFLTDSRSAIMLVLGGTIIYCFVYYIKEKSFKSILIVLLVLALAFVGNDIFGAIKGKSTENRTTGLKITDSSINETIKSVFSMTARSNASRYGYTLATLHVGLKNPILGVGQSYIGSYISEELLENGNINEELAVWKDDQSEAGILNSCYPSFNQYTTSFAVGGIVGLIMDFWGIGLIVLFYLYYFVKNGKKVKSHSFMVFSLLAIVAAWGFSNSFTANYLYVIILGLGFLDVISCYKISKEGEINE